MTGPAPGRGGSLRRRMQTLPTGLGRAPRWLAVLLGIGCVLLGLLLLLRPLSSLSTLVLYLGVTFIVTGCGDLAALAHRGFAPRHAAWPRAVLAVGWVLVGIATLAWPGPTVHAVAVVAGVLLVIDGAHRCWGATPHNADTQRAPADARIAEALVGVAGMVVGIVALAWPDVTLLVIAVTFGVRTTWFGLLLAWHAALGPDRRVADTPAGHGTARRWTRVIASAIAVVLAAGVATVSVSLRDSAPVVDAFYAAPDEVPDEPGELIRSEPFSRDVPDNARAWRILYTTTLDDGQPTVASGLVVVPAGDHPAPVIAWGHGTTGFATTCAPSLADQPFDSGAMFVLDKVIDRGWALVATDYPGLGTAGVHPYLIGQGEGRSMLDAVRAARDLPASLADDTVVWGHSQGGHAALWAGQLATEYAPDVPLSGVAALAPASDLIGLVHGLTSITGGSVFASYVAEAYTDTYHDITFDGYVRPAARVIVRQMSSRCLAEPSVFVSVLAALSLSRDPTIFSADPADGTFGERLRQNIPEGPIAAPLLIAQGLSDPLIDPKVQRAYAARRCAAGQAIDFRDYPGRDHVSLVTPRSPAIVDLLSWTDARFAGAAPTPTCDNGGS